MSKLVWLTDCHLDHVAQTMGNRGIIEFIDTVKAQQPDMVVITGDTSTSKLFCEHISAIEAGLRCPIYFIMGNHDYWGGSMDSLRANVKSLTQVAQQLKYMPLVSHIMIGSKTAVVGHDCWYDANVGDPMRSSFIMNDWFQIKEFQQYVRQTEDTSRVFRDKNSLVLHARKLANEGVNHIAEGIKSASRYANRIFVLSHPVPFNTAHIYNGKQGSNDAAPWYVCKTLGDTLMEAAKAYPNISFVSLSGHTHGEYNGQMLKNLKVHVGGALYNLPRIAGIFDV
jgi:3',5'-cyclic-AMP phosphodiesterase